MNKKDFGLLVATLRKENRNEFDETLTQYDLADLARIPLITLQKVEQGRQANLKAEMLLNLAQALNLSSRARQVFFLASLGIQDSQYVRPTPTALQALAELRLTLAQLQTPAFISDGFGDIILANSLIFSIYNLEPAQLHAPNLLAQYNINRLMFGPEFEAQRAMLGDCLHNFSRRAVMLFKVTTLKYRGHAFFQKLLPELNRYPIFREYWQSPGLHDEDIFSENNRFHLQHPGLGSLKFSSAPLHAVTTRGDLHMNIYNPLDVHTTQACLKLSSQTDTEPVHLAPWPK